LKEEELVSFLIVPMASQTSDDNWSDCEQRTYSKNSSQSNGLGGCLSTCCWESSSCWCYAQSDL